MTDKRPYELVNLKEALELWAMMENPSEFLRIVVADWATNQRLDPYRGMRREEGFPNLWYGVVPHTRDELGTGLGCTYEVFEATRHIKFHYFVTLNNP